MIVSGYGDGILQSCLGSDSCAWSGRARDRNSVRVGWSFPEHRGWARRGRQGLGYRAHCGMQRDGGAMDEYDSERQRGDYLIRGLVGMNADGGSLAIGEHVTVGQTFQFYLRTSDAAHLDLEQTTHALKNRLNERSPVLGLYYFNCLGRGFDLYGQPNHDVNTIRNGLGAFPMIGFFGNAEFAPVEGRNFVHSYTGGLVVLAELDPDDVVKETL